MFVTLQSFTHECESDVTYTRYQIKYSREYFTFVNPLNSACPLLGGYVISHNIPFQLRNSRTKAIVGFTM
jgi:hypothetical protein